MFHLYWLPHSNGPKAETLVKSFRRRHWACKQQPMLSKGELFLDLCFAKIVISFKERPIEAAVVVGSSKIPLQLFVFLAQVARLLASRF